MPGAGPESRVPAAYMLLLLLVLQGRQARGSAARKSRLHSVLALGGAGRVGKGCTWLPTDTQFSFRRGESSAASANPGVRWRSLYESAMGRTRSGLGVAEASGLNTV